MSASRWLVVAAVAWFAGCNKSAPAPGGGASSGEPAPVKVKVASPKRQPLTWVIEQPGTVEPLEITPVVAKVPGYIKAIERDTAAEKAGAKLPGGQPPLIDIGSEVGAGQVLATLDIPELEAEVIEKKAAIARSKAEHALAEKELAVAESQVGAAEAAVKEAEAGTLRADADVARWHAELDQVNTQIRGGIADAQTRNVVTKNWDAARAARTEAGAKVDTAKAGVKERIARRDRAVAEVTVSAERVKVAEAEAERTEALRGYTRITAPFPGIVTARMVHHRRFVDSTSGPLFTVARVDVLRVFVDVPEVSADKAASGAPVVVRVPSLAGREYPAHVTRTTRVVNPETRTLRAEIDIDNADRALAAGTYVVVQITATAADAMVIPNGCVLAADETHSVFLVEGGKAVKYRVQIGRSGLDAVQVLGRRKFTQTAGPWEKFAGTEQVVTGNLGALADGTAVVVE